MKDWRVVVIALSFLLLSGCLVTFKEPLPTNEPAPKGLLGKWTSTNAWGEPLNLELTRVGENQYRAVSYFRAKPKEREAILSRCRDMAIAGICRRKCPRSSAGISRLPASN